MKFNLTDLKRSFFALSFCLTAAEFATAQSFQHGVGTGAAVSIRDDVDGSAYGTLLYNPRIRFMESDNSSLTIGIPLTFGFSGGYSYSSNVGSTNTLQYLIQAPLMLNYNIGAGSSSLTEKRFGFFVGAGFGLTNGNYRVEEWVEDNGGWSYYDYVNEVKTSFGPAANLGMRFGVGRKTKNIEVLFSYMKGITEQNPHYFGASALFNFN